MTASKTALGVVRTNANSVKWGAVAGALVAVASALSAALATGVLKLPPGAEAAVPWVLFLCTVVVSVGAALGVPSYHAGLTPSQSHTANDPKPGGGR
jgi:hypothetical protein